MKAIISVIRRAAGIDGAIFFTLVNKSFSAAANLLTLAVLAIFLSAEEQGYYYTFASLFSLQVFFELGFTFVLTQLVAHEFAQVNAVSLSEEITTRARSRLNSLIRLSKRWFGVIALVFWVMVTLGGYVFFARFQATNISVNWELPWILAIAAFSFGILLLPINAILEGCQQVKEVARIRTLQDMAAFTCFWLALWAGAGLFAISILYVVRSLAGVLLLKRKGLLRLLGSYENEKNEINPISWKKEIFPFQWRIGLSWLAGYLIFSLFTPVLFAYHGPKVAGQMGMTLAIFTGITNLSMAWVVTKVPYFCESIALGKFAELNRTFDNVFTRSTLVNVAFVVVGVLSVHLLSYTPYSDKTLHGLAVLFIAATTVGNHVVFAIATYLRSFKEEPLLGLSIVMGILTGLSTYFLGRHYSANGISFGYMLTTLLVSMPYAYYVFTKKKMGMTGHGALKA
jgi:O-antigen/teichoic acid export membrane protein